MLDLLRRALTRDEDTAAIGLARLLIAAAPFLLTIVALGFLTQSIRTHHWRDEQVHYWPIIVDFSRNFPRMSFADYSSSTPPLYFAVMASLHKFVSGSIAFLRGINLLFLLGACVAFHKLLRDECRMGPRSAALGATALAWSPHVFGNAFLLLTDTMALLLLALAMLFTLRFHRAGRLGDLLAALLLVMLCAMTRQIYAWQYPALGLYLLASRPLREAVSYLPALVMSAFPLALVLLLWGGATPPSWAYKVTPSLAKGLVTAGLGLAVLGFYAIGLVALPVLVRDGREASWRQLITGMTRLHWAVLALALLLLLAVPLGPNTGQEVYQQAGYLWKLAQTTPRLGASSLPFWLLVPAGALFLVETLCRLGPRHPLAYMLPGVVLIGLTTSDAFQKYFDAPALMLVLACAPLYGIAESRPFRLALAGLCAIGLAYAGLSHFYINAT